MTVPRHAHLAISDLLDILPDAVVMVDASSRICYVNPAVRALLGYLPGDLLNQPLTTLVPHAARARHEAVVERFRRDGAPTLMGSRPVLHALHCAGRLVPVSISLCNLTLGDGERVSVAVLHDVSTLNTLLDRATATAETDLLTGLGNRLRLSRRMQALLANQRSFGLLFLDLEKFKQLNDRHGHEVGDQALRIIGQRLQPMVRGADLVARLGGDEFVMLFDGLDDAQRLHRRALSVAQSVTQPLRMEVDVGALGVNIGAAISPRHGQSEQALLQAADQAMYLAKQAGETYRLALD